MESSNSDPMINSHICSAQSSTINNGIHAHIPSNHLFQSTTSASNFLQMGNGILCQPLTVLTTPHGGGGAGGQDSHECLPSPMTDQSGCEGSDPQSPTVIVRTRRRKIGLSEEERLCVICNEIASGYNFDRLTCESCKAFFRRNALKSREKIKPCSRGGGCDIMGAQRKHCPTCRLERCLLLGMKKELILPPEKLVQRAKPKKRHRAMGGSSNHGSSLNVASGYCTNLFGGFGDISDVRPTTGDNVDRTAYPTHLTDASLAAASLNPQSQSLHLSEVNHHNSGSLFELQSQQFSSHLVPSLLDTEKDSVGEIPLGGLTSLPASLNVKGLAQHWALQSTAGRSWDAQLTDAERGMLLQLSDAVLHITQDVDGEAMLSTIDDVGEGAGRLEHAFNQMDGCIRRIISTVKLIPMFAEIDKDAQILMLKLNIYGLVIVYSSFHFDPITAQLQLPGISLIDDLSHCLAAIIERRDAVTHLTQEDLNLYRQNSTNAYTTIHRLSKGDDLVKMMMLSIKLFSSEGLPCERRLIRDQVDRVQSTYSLLLKKYLAHKFGVAEAMQLYPRLLMAFIDVRTVEMKMTEFAKLLSVESLNPLIREVCQT